MVRDAQRLQPDPGNGPVNRLFVPDSVTSQVLHWIHTSPFSWHPGYKRTLELLKRNFFWPQMDQDTQEFVAACTTCARSKASRRAPSGLLHQIPIPGRPWSHIAVDFVTGLPTSRGNSGIFTIVDRFSKPAHFVALPKLPTALRTAELLVDYVVRLHGIPTDMFRIGAPSLCSGFGRPSARLWEPRPACLRAITLRLMAKQGRLTRTSTKQPFVGMVVH